MKKQLFPLLILLITLPLVLVGFASAASADSAAILSASLTEEEAGGQTVSAQIYSQETSLALCAAYDSSGKMLSCKEAPLSSGVDQAQFTFPQANIAQAKLFVLDENNVPQCDFCVVTAEGAAASAGKPLGMSAYSVGRVTVYSTNGNGSIQVNDVNSQDAEGFSSAAPIYGNGAQRVLGFELVSKGDIVTYYQDADGHYVVIPAQTVTGTVTAVSVNRVVIDGQTYTASKLAKFLDEEKHTSLVQAAFVLTRTTLYLDVNGDIVYTTPAVQREHCLLVTSVDAGNTYGKEEAEARFTAVLDTGNQITAYAQSIDGVNIASPLCKTVTADTVYTYTLDDGGNYLLSSVPNAVSISAPVQKRHTDVGGYTANSSTIYVFSFDQGASYTTYDGIFQVPTIEETQLWLVPEEDGVTLDYVFAPDAVDVGAETPITPALPDSPLHALYIIHSAPTVSRDTINNRYVNEYQAVLDGEVTTVISTVDDQIGGNLTVGLYLNVTLKGDGKVDVSTLTDPIAPAPCTAVGDGVILTSAIYSPDGKVHSTAAAYQDDTVVVEIDGGHACAAGPEDISADAEHASQIIVVTASADPETEAYNVADTIYIIK